MSSKDKPDPNTPEGRMQLAAEAQRNFGSGDGRKSIYTRQKMDGAVDKALDAIASEGTKNGKKIRKELEEQLGGKGAADKLISDLKTSNGMGGGLKGLRRRFLNR